MTNLSKAKKYAIGAGIGVGFANAALNAILQLDEMKKNPNQKFGWGKLTKAGLMGAAAGAATGLAVGGTLDLKNSMVKPLDTNAYLHKKAESLKLKKDSPEFKRLDQNANTLSDMLVAEFGNLLVCRPERIGSTEKGTALNYKFDVDIGLKFRHNSFQTTSDMRFALLTFLKSKIGSHSIIAVREQTRSVGVIFQINGKDNRIDVAPLKVTAGNKDSGFLSVKNESFLNDDYTRQKTNLRALKSVKLNETQKRIVVLLKNWRVKNNVPLGSHLLECLVLDAYRYAKPLPQGFTKKVIMVLRHIETNLDVAVIRSVENTNNVVTRIDSYKKDAIIAACRKTVEEYKYQPNSVQSEF